MVCLKESDETSFAAAAPLVPALVFGVSMATEL